MTGKTLALSLFLLPLFAVPLYLAGQGIAGALDDDRSNGVLALGLMLGVPLPGLASIIVARAWGELKWVPALALGFVTGGISLVVLFGAFLVSCSATNCVV